MYPSLVNRRLVILRARPEQSSLMRPAAALDVASWSQLLLLKKLLTERKLLLLLFPDARLEMKPEKDLSRLSDTARPWTKTVVLGQVGTRLLGGAPLLSMMRFLPLGRSGLKC